MRPAAKHWLARAVAAALCGVTVACSDGYPTDDAPPLFPSTMTHAQLLRALNELGDKPHLGRRWRYALGPGCELEVRVQHDDGGRRRVALQHALIESASQDGQIDVRVVPSSADDEIADGAVTVLETQRWTDSVLARSLLTQLEMRCSESRTEPA